MTTPPMRPDEPTPGAPGADTEQVPSFAPPPGATYPPGTYPQAPQEPAYPGVTYPAVPAAGQPPVSQLPSGAYTGATYPGTPPQYAPQFAAMPPGQGPVPVPVAAQAPTGRSGSSRALNILLGAAVLIAAVGVAFAVGRTTAPTQTASSGGQGRVFAGGNGPNASFAPNGGFPGGGTAGGRGFGLAGGISVQGTVDSVSADSITIKTSTGTTITVGLDSSTTYHQQAPATQADVTAGKTVILQLSGGGFRPGGFGGGNGSGGNGGTGNGNGGNGGSGNGNGGTGNGNGGGANGGTGGFTLGTASSVTVVP